ncbi:4,5-DOPA dioxygenase extradiol 1-like [Amaranthus tricolor]|nr:4,5-DOPA dioxygenase extradiol 1-like [Amaranthus tricolor]
MSPTENPLINSNPKTIKMVEKEMNFNETFFITHGNPILTVEDSHPLRPFFETWKQNIFSKKPKAILVISGHWETDFPSVNAVDINDTIHDFDDYPDAMYQLKYPAPGSIEMAKKVEEILTKSGYKTINMDKKRGLDHGAWVPLMYMYPQADIPVCQLSVQPKLSGTYHYNLGRALAPLKQEGVLIIGSGSATHPLDETPHFHNGVAPWAHEFHSWLHSALINRRIEEVNTYESKAPNWELAHPFPEHFYPLHIVMGAAGDNWKAELIHSSWDHGTLYHGAYKFTSN